MAKLMDIIHAAVENSTFFQWTGLSWDDKTLVKFSTAACMISINFAMKQKCAA